MANAKATSGAAPKRRPRCGICMRAIHRPAGWSSGAATRRHYWARHREVMQPGRKTR